MVMYLKNKASKSICLVCVLVFILLTSICSAATNQELISGKSQTLPVVGMVTFVDIGAHKCIPCKMMAPIIKELATAYEGKAAIAFVDIWLNPDEAKKYNVRSIPTQIFFDASGNEVFRHVGFYRKEEIVAQLNNLGVHVGD